MERLFWQKLVQWKENVKMPLMVVGARQTGKTYIIDKFCTENFDNYVYINLELNLKVRDIFEATLNPDEIVKAIELVEDVIIDPENTVIFLDEIQVSENAITSLKYFCESKKNYKIVTAGSLLGVKINRFKSSFPVGKVRIEHLYPMTFEEFLMAKNKSNLLDEIRDCYINNREMIASVHNVALTEYRDYLAVGGMPKAVKNYMENECNIARFDRKIHEDIITSYIADMRKYTYTNTETINIQDVFESMPMQLGKENKKFKYSLVEKGATRKKYKTPLDWLIASEILLKCSRTKLLESPLKAYIDTESFKMYMSDVGLLNKIANVNFKNIILDEEFIFKGAIAENYIAQIFIEKNYGLHYFKSKSGAEIDFILDTEDGIIPVEVKAGDNTRSRSLNEYIEKYKPKYAIRISAKNFGFAGNIKSVPLYAAHLI